MWVWQDWVGLGLGQGYMGLVDEFGLINWFECKAGLRVKV